MKNILCLVTLVITLVSCKNETNSNGKLNVVTTTTKYWWRPHYS